mgnify:CR=1 FL=1
MNKILKNTLILTAITLIAGLGLGLVHEITLNPIAQAQEKAKKEAWQAVFPDAKLDEFKETDVDQKAADKAAKAAAAKPEDEKLAKAAEVAAQAAKDAADGTKIPETFKDYLQKYVYGCKDQDDLLNVLGGARLMNLKNEPHLGYSTRH